MSNVQAPVHIDPPQKLNDALPVGARLGEFEVRRVLGIGGFGIVYLAWDHALEREVALKEYLPVSLAGRGAGPQVTLRPSADVESFATGLRSFVNEARLLARFDHPSLVKVHRFWEDHGTAYMVMPFYRGRTLREVRRAMTEPYDEASCRRLVDPLLSALELLHSEGVFHRDIAPDNILLGDDGVPVLLDFGAARRVLNSSQSMTAILKPSFAPLEQYDVSATRQGAWTDLYGLGATVHYLLTGRPPPPAAARALGDELAPLAQQGRPGCSVRFLGAIDWTLALAPQARPQSVAALRDALDGRVSPSPAMPRTNAAEAAVTRAAGLGLRADSTGRAGGCAGPVAPLSLGRGGRRGGAVGEPVVGDEAGTEDGTRRGETLEHQPCRSAASCRSGSGLATRDEFRTRDTTTPAVVRTGCAADARARGVGSCARARASAATARGHGAERGVRRPQRRHDARLHEAPVPEAGVSRTSRMPAHGRSGTDQPRESARAVAASCRPGQPLGAAMARRTAEDDAGDCMNPHPSPLPARERESSIPQPLAGLRVVEFTHMVMGPTCGMVLADLGAEVIKVEPIDGDRTRTLVGAGAGFFPMFNRNKKSIAIDLRQPEGAAVARKLAAGADIVAENFKPGTMAKYGLDYEALSKVNDRLIYVSHKGFLPGPYEHRTALDEVVQMMGGLAYMTGRPGDPLRAGTSVNDIMGGLFGAIGALGALIQRGITGRGMEVQSALYENNVFLVGQHMLQYAMTGRHPAPMPARESPWAVYDVFTVKDGEQIFLAAVSDAQWTTFCRVLGFEDLAADPALVTNNQRCEARPVLLKALRERLSHRPAAELAALMEQAGLPFAPIRRPEDLFDDPHLTATGGLADIRLPDGERAGQSVKTTLFPITLDGERLPVRLDPPKRGEHTRELLRAIGYAPEEIDTLIAHAAVA